MAKKEVEVVQAKDLVQEFKDNLETKIRMCWPTLTKQEVISIIKTI